VFGLRAVAGFAVHVRMLAFASFVGYVGVAAFAGVMTGKLHRVSGDFSDGCAAIVTVLAKAWGNDEVADHQENEEREDKEPRKSE
jgi:cyanate permease